MRDEMNFKTVDKMSADNSGQRQPHPQRGVFVDIKPLAKFCAKSQIGNTNLNSVTLKTRSSSYAPTHRCQCD